MDPGEKEAALKNDPTRSTATGCSTTARRLEDELMKIEQAHAETIEQALEFALASPFPELSELRHDVYAYEVVE